MPDTAVRSHNLLKVVVKRHYLYSHSTANFHVYKWTGAPADSKSFLTTMYVLQSEMPEGKVPQFVMEGTVEL